MFDPNWRAAYATPGDLAVQLDPRTIQTPALDLIDAALVEAATTPDARLIICMPPQEGKSFRCSRWFPLWLLHRNPDTRIAIISYESNIARRWGRAVRDTITQHGKALGLRIRDDLAAQHEWQLDGHEGGVYTVGIGGALTGRPVDCLTGETRVVTADGYIPIRDLYQSGNPPRVLSFNHATGSTEWSHIIAKRAIPDRELVEVTTTGGRSFTCTPDHRIATADGYRSASLLRPGDALIVGRSEHQTCVRALREGAQEQGPDVPRLLQEGARVDVSDDDVRLVPGEFSEDASRAREAAPRRPDRGVLLPPLRCGLAPFSRSAMPMLWQADGVDRPTAPVLLAAVPRSHEAPSEDQGMPAVRDRLLVQQRPAGLLHQGVREHSALGTNDRDREQSFQGRHQLRRVVPADAPLDPRTRRSSVPCLQGTGYPDCDAVARAGRDAQQLDPSPPQRATLGQPPTEPDHAVQGLPCDPPQVGADTVRVVRRLHGRRDTVYDLQVEGNRNFFAEEVLVHNCMIIDDPIKDRADADSPTIRGNVIDWWTDTGSTRLAPGAPVILIQTRWHPDDLAGWLLQQEDAELWRVISIPAQAEALDPADDPLHRPLGEYMASARRRTIKQWEAIKRRSPARTWAALYQQRPTPAEGTVWQESWISAFRGRTGDAMHKWVSVLVGVDPAVTSKTTSDETGIVVTAMDTEGTAWVVDDRSLRGTPTEWGCAVWHAVFDWGGTGIVIEDNQGGEMVLTVLQTSWPTAVNSYLRLHPSWHPMIAPPITRVHASRSKRIRAESVAAIYEVGKVRHAADGTDRLAALEDQMTAWTGVGDSPDRIDALVHALTALFLPKHADAGVGAQRQQAASRRRAAGRR
jgi:hypothetical protein